MITVNPAASAAIIPMLMPAFLLGGLVFNVFLAFCLWRVVNAFEEISMSLAKIAAKAKDESRL